jgi:23S rRNA pseudouridine1911/1915/1917 synthase
VLPASISVKRSSQVAPVIQSSPEYKEPVSVPDTEDKADDTASGPDLRSATATVAWHGQRLDKVLVAMAPEFSRSHLQQLLGAGHVQLAGVVVQLASRKVHIGQRIDLELVPTEESQAFRPQAMALQVLFEDEHVLVLNKAAGLVVHPAPGNWQGTLLNGVLAHHAAAAGLPRGGIVHRLDKDTSGVMVLGKSLPAVTALTRAIAARAVKRRYLALVHGRVSAAPFSIEEPVGRDPKVRVRMAVVPVAAGGRASRTDVQCVASQAGISAVVCQLHTGRTHQIRVHMAAQGYPLVADAVYGGKPALELQRQALHAVHLAFEHPLTGQAMHFDCPPPADFAAAWQQVCPAGLP